MQREDQELVTDALAFALESHAEQRRKGSGAPYVCHLLQVSGLVFEHGGSAEQAAAGLLHDVVEDCGVSSEELARRFGTETARIVEACTDLLPGDTPEHKSPWQSRKDAFLASLRDADVAVRRVAGCDKLDNLRSLLADLEVEGPEVFERFSATPSQSLWYYREVCSLLDDESLVRVRRELAHLCESLEHWVARVEAPGVEA